VSVPPEQGEAVSQARPVKFLAIFLLSTFFYRVRDSAPDGSSPQGYSQNFRV
jgi:hypothetical protein